jgi:hypothetical protein
MLAVFYHGAIVQNKPAAFATSRFRMSRKVREFPERVWDRDLDWDSLAVAVTGLSLFVLALIF